MPHIHTEPGQHDATISLYIVRQIDGEWKGLVHLHRKLHVLMQTGGHIELTETPWQAVEHELREETGYSLSELLVLQPDMETPIRQGAVTHPIPFCMNTHTAGPGHYHSDACYAFVAVAEARQAPVAGESQDIRWLSLHEMEHIEQDESETILGDVIDIYRSVIERGVETYKQVPADTFSLEHPTDTPGLFDNI